MKHLDTLFEVWRDDYHFSLRERTQPQLISPNFLQTSTTARAGHLVLSLDTLPSGCW